MSHEFLQYLVPLEERDVTAKKADLLGGFGPVHPYLVPRHTDSAPTPPAEDRLRNPKQGSAQTPPE